MKGRIGKRKAALQIDYATRRATLTRRTRPPADPVIAGLLERGFSLADVQTVSVAGGARSAKSAVLELDARRPPGTSLVAVLVHPSGAVTYHFPEASRGSGRSRIRIAISPGPPDGRSPTRAPSALRYVLVVLGTTLAKGLLRKTLSTLVSKWERAGIDHSLFRIEGPEKKSWTPLSLLPHNGGRRGLLLVHGIFSSVSSSFAPLFEGPGRKLLEKLIEHYDGNVVGFDHPSVSVTPEENARWLLGNLESGGRCRYDVLATSRGGLVTRALVELAGRRRGKRRTRPALLVDRAVLVGTPNLGTPIAPSPRSRSRDPYSRLASYLSTISPLVPSEILGEIVDFLAELLRYLAFDISGELPGITALAPGSPFLGRLNAPSTLGGTLYYGIGADFDAPRSLLMRLADAGMDAIFEGEPNDLVVPAAGTIAADSPLPAGQAAVFSPYAPEKALEADIDHFTYFENRKCLKMVEAFLALPPRRSRRSLRAAGPAPAERRGRLAPVRAAEGIADLVGERPDFSTPMPRLDIAVIGDHARRRDYLAWLERWRKVIAEAEVTSLPPEPFPVLFVSSGLSRFARTFKTRGDDTYWHSLIGTERSIRRYLEDAGPALSLERLEEAGTMLYKSIFKGESEELLDRIAGERYMGSPTLVTFTTTSPWLADFPWEMMFDPRKKRFINLGDICFFRGVMSTTAALALPALPLVIRMLVAVSQPTDQVPLDAQREVEGLMSALGHLTESKRLYIDVLEHTTPKKLVAKLKKARYHILHYIGHGDYDERSDTGTLVLEKERTGTSLVVDSDGLCELLVTNAPFMRLVLLNGCETAEGGRADFNRGVAPALVAAGIPGAIGNRLIVGDRAAISFSKTFYEELSRRKSLAEAVMSARRALALSSEFEPYEWAVPMIFAIDPEARFF